MRSADHQIRHIARIHQRIRHRIYQRHEARVTHLVLRGRKRERETTIIRSKSVRLNERKDSEGVAIE